MRLFAKKNKRGIQLAINFLVTFILAIVIFGFGIVIIKQVVSSSGSSLDDISGNVEKRLQSLSCSAKDKLCISNNEATVKRDDVLYFGAHVNNYLNDPITFTITIDISTGRGYNSKQEEIQDIPIKAFLATHTLTVSPKQQGEQGLALVIPKETKPGQYYYTIKVTGSGGYGEVSDTLSFTVK